MPKRTEARASKQTNRPPRPVGGRGGSGAPQRPVVVVRSKRPVAPTPVSVLFVGGAALSVSARENVRKKHHEKTPQKSHVKRAPKSARKRATSTPSTPQRTVVKVFVYRARFGLIFCARFAQVEKTPGGPVGCVAFFKTGGFLHSLPAQGRGACGIRSCAAKSGRQIRKCAFCAWGCGYSVGFLWITC